MQPTSPTEPGTPERDALRERVLDRIMQNYGITEYAVPMADDIMLLIDADRAALLQSLRESLDSLYNPGITDLERDEYQGKEKEVVYVDQVQQLLSAEDEGKNV